MEDDRYINAGGIRLEQSTWPAMKARGRRARCSRMTTLW